METKIYQLEDERGFAQWREDNPNPTEEENEEMIRRFFRPRTDMAKDDLDYGYDPHGDNDV